jgi:hypothetical protein
MRRRTEKSIAIALAMSATLCIIAVPAAAQEPGSEAAARAAQVQRLSEEGAALFRARDYRRANEKLQQAYSLDPDPNLLFNIAKCYEALGDNAAAIEKYEHFLREPGADPGGKMRAQESLRTLRGAGTQAHRGDQPSAEGTEQRYVAPTLIALGVGVVGLAAGTAFGVVALGKRSDLDTVCVSRACPPASKDDITALKTTSTISTVGFVVGAIGLATGIVLYVMGKRPSSPPQERPAATVRVSPSIGWSSAGLSGTF